MTYTVKPNYSYYKVVDENNKLVAGFYSKEQTDDFAKKLNESDPITALYVIEQYKNKRFKKGDRIIWDSGFGYDIGHFVEVGQVFENNYVVNLKTGVTRGSNCSFPQSEVHHYSENLIKLLTEKYGYTKKF